jgi:uncharacterized protein affecting Mg2+/Co2+ transport
MVHAGGLYSYSIRMSVPEACMLGGVYYPSCQLQSRHWIIRCGDTVVSDVRGEGVIGKVCLKHKRKLSSSLFNVHLFLDEKKM